MTRRVILHVGPHKTASTYLQCRLLLARAALAEHGFRYPEYGVAQFAHHRVYNFLNEHTRAESGLEEAALREAFAGSTDLILSSENFVYLGAPQLTALKAMLPDCGFEIVYFLRNPVHLWPSHWQELVKHGRDVTFLEYLGALNGWTGVMDPAAADPVQQLAAFAACFGAPSLRILCLDNIVADGTDLFVHFWHSVLGISAPAPVQSVPPLNPSFPAPRIELLRCLNRRYADIAGQRPREIIMQAYNAQAEEIEGMPRFRAFTDAFAQWAVPVTLDSAQPFIRQRDRALVARFGRRIENAAAPDRIYAAEAMQSRTLSGDRYWPSRFGFYGFVDQVLQRLVPADNF